jgi:hypothetical protein
LTTVAPLNGFCAAQRALVAARGFRRGLGADGDRLLAVAALDLHRHAVADLVGADGEGAAAFVVHRPSVDRQDDVAFLQAGAFGRRAG